MSGLWHYLALTCLNYLCDRLPYPEPLAAELGCGIGLVLPEQLHISAERRSLSYTNIRLCLDGLRALLVVSTETGGQGNVRHTNVL